MAGNINMYTQLNANSYRSDFIRKIPSLTRRTIMLSGGCYWDFFILLPLPLPFPFARKFAYSYGFSSHALHTRIGSTKLIASSNNNKPQVVEKLALEHINGKNYSFSY